MTSKEVVFIIQSTPPEYVELQCSKCGPVSIKEEVYNPDLPEGKTWVCAACGKALDIIVCYEQHGYED
jgi:hypothetical protein